jgi:hypothetical protein
VLAGLSLFYIGTVLCLNGFWLLGRIRDKEIAVIACRSSLLTKAS